MPDFSAIESMTCPNKIDSAMVIIANTTLALQIKKDAFFSLFK